MRSQVITDFRNKCGWCGRKRFASNQIDGRYVCSECKEEIMDLKIQEAKRKESLKNAVPVHQ